jgi:predicted ATPase
MVLKVIYSEEGIAVADKKAMEYAENAWFNAKCSEDDVVLEIGSYHVILAFRLLVKRGIIPCRSLLFFYQSTKRAIRVDQNGELSDFPKGFHDTYSNMLIELI